MFLFDVKRLISTIKAWRVGSYPALAIVAALSVGAAIPPQGSALRSLGDTLGSYPLAAATSLAGGAVVFTIALVIFNRSSLIDLFKKNTRKWYFYFSGAPGAAYITFYSLAIAEAGIVAASLAGVFGIVMFVLTGWSTLGKRLPFAITGAACVFAATWLVGGMVHAPSSYGVLLLALTMVTGFGVSWQFSTLGAMSRKSSVLAAATVSSVSGCLSALLLFVLFAVLGLGEFAPSNSWPTTANGIWMYSCSLEGVWIILAGAYASSRLRKIYPVIMVSGNLLSGLTIGWIITGVSAVKLTAQICGIVIAISGVAISVFDDKARQILTKTTRLRSKPDIDT
jgi:uncharacterized membrane protein YdcZ (DUF606 family)